MPSLAKKPVAFTTGLSISDRRTPAADQDVQMIPDSQHGSGPKNPLKAPPFSWNWKGVHFVRVAPGVYDAFCVNSQGPEWVRAYKRWSLRLGFSLIAETAEVSAYFNMGRSSRPEISRGGRYFEAWCIANGSGPQREQDMSPSLFLDPGLLFTVEVEDATFNASRQHKPQESVYSRVKKILAVSYS